MEPEMQATPCANSQYLAAYLRDEDRAYRRDTWIENEAEAKLKAMKPFTPGDFDEAVSEVMADKTKNAAILAAFAGTDDCALGKALRDAVDAYWLSYCTNQAADDYDDGAADPDYGRY